MKRRFISKMRVSERGFAFEEIKVDVLELRAKLGADGIPPNATHVALAAVEQLREEFEVWVRKDVGRVRELVQRLRGEPSHAERQEHCAELRRLAHDLRGQGATFDYPLATDLAEMLGTCSRALHLPVARQADLIAKYADLIERVVEQRIRGVGGREGQAVMQSAQGLADHVQPPTLDPARAR